MELFAKKATKEPSKPTLGATPKESSRDTQPTSTATVPRSSFEQLGLCDWLCKSVSAMGFRRPTDIQTACIPAILAGRDVMGCAETGSGKTAAFALPILHHLSSDPYGIFAIILTPTRELAIQISEQISVFGGGMGVRQTLIIGGVQMTEQSLELSKLPHIVIATPGRLRHHLEGPDAPNLSRAQYIVLDEADRLLSAGFSSELNVILSRMSPKRKTLLFSATLTTALAELEALAMRDTLKFDLTLTQRVPSGLQQQYLFIPSQVKLCYLVAVIRSVILAQQKAARIAEEAEDELDKLDSTTSIVRDILDELGSKQTKSGGGKAWKSKTGGGAGGSSDKKGKKRGREGSSSGDESRSRLINLESSSIIVFVSACKRCEEIAGMLQEMDINCVALHSMLSQHQRIASLSQFKSQACRILVATDVASRGLDIPSVDLVINVDLPKVVADYVHRVGRTSRAGRLGRALSFVTQHDVELLHGIEDFIGTKLECSTEVTQEEVVELLNPVSKAMRSIQMKLMENGFEEKLEVRGKRKKKQKRQMLRQYAKEVVSEKA